MEVETKGTHGSRKRAYFLSRLSRSTRQPLEIELLGEHFFLNSTVSTIVSNLPKLKSKVHAKLGLNVQAVSTLLRKYKIRKFVILKSKVGAGEGCFSDGRNLSECVSVGLSSVTSEEKLLFRHGEAWIRADEKLAGNYSHAPAITSPVRDNKRSRRSLPGECSRRTEA